MHQGPVKIGEYGETVIVHVDSSIKSRGYAVLEMGDEVRILPCGGECGEEKVVPT